MIRKDNIARKDFIHKEARAFGLFALKPSVFFAKGNAPSLKKEIDSKMITGLKAREGGQIRGSWIRRRARQKGDVVLTQNGTVCQIVVASEENPAVHKAAHFLASDVEKITGKRPSVEDRLDRQHSLIRLITYEKGHIPNNINVANLKGER